MDDLSRIKSLNAVHFDEKISLKKFSLRGTGRNSSTNKQLKNIRSIKSSISNIMLSWDFVSKKGI